MIQKKYFVYANSYSESQAVKTKIYEFFNTCYKRNLCQEHWIIDSKNPDLVFCVGGDGTLLHAIHQLQAKLATTIFVPIKSGSLCFYSTFVKEKIIKFLPAVLKKTFKVKTFPLLEIEGCDHKKISYALNEIRVVDNIKSLRCQVFINDDLLEYFRGTGLIFATASGSSGYMKAIGGAVIISEQTTLWEAKEIAPVNNSFSKTLINPFILDEHQEIRICGALRHKKIIADTYLKRIPGDVLTIRVSKTKLKVMYNEVNMTTKTKLLRNAFALSSNSNNPLGFSKK